MRKQGQKPTPLLGLGAMFAACAAGLTALGVAALSNAIRGGPALGIFTLVLAVAIFCLAGYFFWGYRWLQKRPEVLSKAEQRKAEKRLGEGGLR